MLCKKNNQLLKKIQDKPEKIVLVGGCFDLLHYGHVSFLKEAKKLGNYLIVLLESDENVKMLKGEGRPFHTQAQRKEMLLSLACIDEVRELPSNTTNETYNTLIASIRPSVITLTEGDPKLELKTKQAELVGAGIVVIPKIHTPSTSQLAKLLDIE